ncbi:MAG: fatty acid desaturase family protein [Myxococcota bacterium]
MATKITDVLQPEEIREFTSASNLHGTFAVFLTWALIAGCFALVIAWPHPLSYVVALIVLGGRHLGLAILMHEASHRSLFAHRGVNDFVGHWLCAAPSWSDVVRYRTHHLAHHAHTGTERDTDLGLVRPFPITRGSLVRKFIRDLLGLTGIKRVVGLLMIDFGYLHYTASVDAEPIDQTGRSFGHVLRTGARNLYPMVITNGIMLAALWAAGHPWLYGLWILSYLTTFSLFLRIRAIAEHACTGNVTDPFRNTRTTRAGILARLTVAPHGVNYHLEHHLLMTVPYFRLGRLHRLLKQRGALEESPVADSYLDVLRQVTTPQPA